MSATRTGTEEFLLDHFRAGGATSEGYPASVVAVMSFGMPVRASSNVTFARTSAMASACETLTVSTPFTRSSVAFTSGPHRAQSAWWTVRTTVRGAAWADDAASGNATAAAMVRGYFMAFSFNRFKANVQ